MVALAVLLFAVWSSMFSLAKVALQYSPPIFLTGFWMVAAGALLLAYLAIFKRHTFRFNGKQLLSLACLGISSIYLTNVLEFWALQYLSAAKACFIYSLSPFFAAFLSYLHFGEKMSFKKWLGLSIGFAGILPVLSLQTGAEELWMGFLSWPALAVIGAAFFSVYGWVLLRLVVKDQTVSPVMANGTSMLFGGLLALTHSFFADSWNPTPIAAGHLTPFLGWALLITFVSNIVCYNIYGLLLQRFTATFLSFVGLLSPIFASLHGWLFLGEPVSWVVLGSTAIISLGLWVVYSAELKQGYIKKSAAT